MFDRITSDPAILGGKPIIRGSRIASGATRDDVLRRTPHLAAADVEQALAYAAASVRNEILTSSEIAS